MSNEEYTPTTEEVRGDWATYQMPNIFDVREEYAKAEAEFDRWLNEQLAAAWDAGAKRRNGDSFMRENYQQTLAKNPYRPEESS